MTPSAQAWVTTHLLSNGRLAPFRSVKHSLCSLNSQFLRVLLMLAPVHNYNLSRGSAMRTKQCLLRAGARILRSLDVLPRYPIDETLITQATWPDCDIFFAEDPRVLCGGETVHCKIAMNIIIDQPPNSTLSRSCHSVRVAQLHFCIQGWCHESAIPPCLISVQYQPDVKTTTIVCVSGGLWCASG